MAEIDSGGDRHGRGIVFDTVNKWYGQMHVLQDVSFHVAPGEKIVVCGPSGSGKSTMIRCINRLEAHQSGTISVGGIEVTDQRRNLDRVRRQVGMVFQNFNLYPHLTILENCTIAQRWVRGLPRAEAEQRAMRYLERVRIPDQAGKYPSQLSGGQQQRVAIARALALEPKVMLFDEPTSALDPELVGSVLNVMREMRRDGMTMVVVSHEMRFAQEAADRVVFMNGGNIVEQGPPEQIFKAPTQARTREFLARMFDH